MVRLCLKVGGMKSLRRMAQHILRSMNLRSLTVGSTSALLPMLLEQCLQPARSLCVVRKHMLRIN